MSLQKMIDSPADLIADASRAAAAAAPDLAWNPRPGYFTRRTPTDEGRVALLSGGGSGHEPMHAGFVGAGMLDGACPGLVFTSPNAIQIEAATRAVDSGAGVVHIVKNYTGDIINFRVAATMCRDSGMRVGTVVVADDVASESDDGPGRRGTGATIVVEKVCGASAARGDDFDTVLGWGQRVADASRSMAVAYRACTVPGSTEPSFELGDDEVELGVGIHGERGTSRVSTPTARELVAALLDPILASSGIEEGADVILVVNGLGASHPLELNVVFGDAAEHLREKGVRVRRVLVGTFVTAFDMAGVSLTLVTCDDDMLELWDAPTAAPGWPNAPVRDIEWADRETDDRPVAQLGDGGEPDAVVSRWVSSFVQRVSDAVDDLTDLDRRAGDGDFGTNMSAGLAGVELRETDSPATLFERLARGFLEDAGGTSGALFGVFFHRLAVTFADHGVSAETLADGTAAGLDAITELGGARVGDKTMVDALAPASEALRAEPGRSLADATAAAASAAARGVEETADLLAQRGRASYVGDAARGVVDPGALVISWFFEEAAAAAR